MVEDGLLPGNLSADGYNAWIESGECATVWDSFSEGFKMKALSDEKILDSWHKNAAPWSLAVREGQIDSRRLVTDSAIVGAVEEYGRAYTRPSVLDIGCG
ncbi:MAG: hypothetical protein P8Y45_10450 [Exilibacterium sp.]